MKTMLVVGIVILLAGIGTFAYGAVTPVVTTSSSPATIAVASPTVASQGVSAKADWETGSAYSQGVAVQGTFSVKSYNSSAGPYFFYVMNKAHYVTWGGCAPCKSPNEVNGTAGAGGTFTFSYTVPSNDSYFFVFDGLGYKAPSVVSLNTNATTSVNVVTNTSSPNNTMIYSGSGVALVGLIVAAVTMMGKGKAAEGMPKSPT